VSVRPDEQIETALVETETERKRSTQVAKFIAARIGERLLLVRVPVDYQPQSVISGDLEPFTQLIETNVVNPLRAQGRDTKTALLPYYLNAPGTFRRLGLMTVAWLVTLAGAIWCFMTSLNRTSPAAAIAVSDQTIPNELSPPPK
jgi:hypothetical protein